MRAFTVLACVLNSGCGSVRGKIGWAAITLVILLILLAVVSGFPEGQEPHELKRYASVQEAEQVAGLYIPRPGPQYSATYTSLEWWGHDHWPVSYTSYSVVGVANRSIGVSVGPHDYLDSPSDTLIMNGTPTTIGGRSGWIMGETDVARGTRLFAFMCGSVDDLTVWCEVDVPKHIGFDALEAFVATIR